MGVGCPVQALGDSPLITAVYGWIAGLVDFLIIWLIDNVGLWISRFGRLICICEVQIAINFFCPVCI